MFEAIKRMFARTDENKFTVEYLTSPEDHENGTDGWFIVRPDGMPHAGPYSREKDAKGQLTRLQRSYTAAARRP